jgi:hypothetical protein
LSEVTGSVTGHLPLALDQVSLINEAQLRLMLIGETDMDLIEDKADHTLAAQAATTDPIYSPSSGFDSEYDKIVYMVEQGGELSEKTTEELQQEAEDEIARAKHLAWELDKRKGHNGLQDDLGPRRMSTQMEPLQGSTVQSSTHDATLTKIVFDIGHDRSARNSVGSSTRESKFIARQPTTPWLQG